MLKRFGYAYGILLFVAVPSAVSAQGTDPANAAAARLAYFSPQRAFYESVDGKAAQARLSSIQAATSRQVEEQNARLKALQTALAQNSLLLSDAARREREQEIEKFQIDLKRFVEDAQAEFLGVQRELESAFPRQAAARSRLGGQGPRAAPRLQRRRQRHRLGRPGARHHARHRHSRRQTLTSPHSHRRAQWTAGSSRPSS